MTANREGLRWTSDDITTLKDLARRNTPTGLIAYTLERTEAAIYKKSTELKISLKPTNKSPYGNSK